MQNMRAAGLVVFFVFLVGCSSTQKTAGWLLVGAGSIASFAGGVYYGNEVSNNVFDMDVATPIGLWSAAGALMGLGVILIVTDTGPTITREEMQRERTRTDRRLRELERQDDSLRRSRMDRQRMWEERQQWERTQRRHREARRRYYEKHGEKGEG